MEPSARIGPWTRQPVPPLRTAGGAAGHRPGGGGGRPHRRLLERRPVAPRRSRRYGKTTLCGMRCGASTRSSRPARCGSTSTASTSAADWRSASTRRWWRGPGPDARGPRHPSPAACRPTRRPRRRQLRRPGAGRDPSPPPRTARRPGAGGGRERVVLALDEFADVAARRRTRSGLLRTPSSTTTLRPRHRLRRVPAVD